MERVREIFRIKEFLYILGLIIFLSGCATVPPRVAPSVSGIYHIVGAGETIYRIAKRYNVDVAEIMRVNRISDPTQIRLGQRIFIPGAKMPLKVEIPRFLTLEQVERIVGKKNIFSSWHYITIHHSATDEGNARVFDRYHRLRRMGGLFYHFVIGNGKGSRDGEIEVGWRWREQVEVNRPKDIQICLVGNFNKDFPSDNQLDSLVKLIKVLSKQYNIPLNNIRRHKDVSSTTECPGKYFPFYQVIKAVKEK